MKTGGCDVPYNGETYYIEYRFDYDNDGVCDLEITLIEKYDTDSTTTMPAAPTVETCEILYKAVLADVERTLRDELVYTKEDYLIDESESKRDSGE